MVPMITGIKNNQGAVNQTEFEKLHGGISIRILHILSDAGPGSTSITRIDQV